jgi:hypothetical protein
MGMNCLMGWDVKTQHPHPPDALSSLHPASAPAMLQRLNHALPARECVPSLGANLNACSLVVTGNLSSRGIPDDIAAALFSTEEWKPSFYQGLDRPLLGSAFRGGIAYAWGLRTVRFGTRQFTDTLPQHL